MSPRLCNHGPSIYLGTLITSISPSSSIMLLFNLARKQVPLPQHNHACPSSSISTVGSMSFHQPRAPFEVISSVTKGLPMASTKGPVGLSLTATPTVLLL